MSAPKIPVCAAPDPAPKPGGFSMPDGACDCHVHVFTSASTLVTDRVYTPHMLSLTDYRRVSETLGLQRAVIVQPSVYGSDNKATLEAATSGGENFRAVVVLDNSATPRSLQEMHEQGARGARINVLFSGAYRRENLLRLGALLAEYGWHMQMLVDVSQFDDLESLVDDLPMPVVFDHMGHVPAEKGVDDPGFQALLRLMAEGKVWTKLSGSYRMTRLATPPYNDVSSFARALVEANPERCVWASDWPHPHIPVDMPNDGDLLNMLTDWVPNQSTRNCILVANPAQLYGFTT